MIDRKKLSDFMSFQDVGLLEDQLFIENGWSYSKSKNKLVSMLAGGTEPV